ncbi:MAG: LLM class flavin-dependent oxidoreductase [Deltaproteobacteria bacterium]|nr:LLM class flavin-dependent oxidoreductase [Deltaproteobacteria bacterium]
MRFYVNILSTYFPDLDPPYEVYYRQMLEQIELAEELGFECFMFNEHHFLGYGGLVANPAVMLAAAATRTSRIRLGPCIAILSVRHPLQVAEDYAMVDAISGGRLEFGIGLGNTALDYRVFETPQEEGRARYQEAHDIIVKAWTQERFSHEGEFWKFEEITLYPRPVQQPLPLTWVAGTSPEGLGWAGRNGYHIMTVGHPHPPDKVGAGVQAWREGLAATGRDPADYHCQYHLRTYVNENAMIARETGEKAIDRYEAISRIQRKAPPPPGFVYDWKGMLETGRNLYGTPEQCIEIIKHASRHYHFDTLTHNFNFGGLPHEEVKKSMRLFAHEVMPAFR